MNPNLLDRVVSLRLALDARAEVDPETIKRVIDEVIDHLRAPDDPVVADVCSLMRNRSVVGKSKYGTMLSRTDLPLRAWQQHLLEELLDAALYLRRQQGHTAESINGR